MRVSLGDYIGWSNAKLKKIRSLSEMCIDSQTFII